jgi:hypothetical protein
MTTIRISHLTFGPARTIYEAAKENGLGALMVRRGWWVFGFWTVHIYLPHEVTR